MLNIGKGCYLSAGAKIIGKESIGNYCTLGVDTVLHNMSISDNIIAYNDKNGVLQLKMHDNSRLLSAYFDLKGDIYIS